MTELRCHRLKRWLARLGASLLVGLVAFTLMSLALRSRMTPREWLMTGLVYALVAWGGWSINFLITRHKS